MESKPTLGLILLKGKKTHHRVWLEKHNVNGFLKQAQKTNRYKEMSIERLAHVYALLMVEEEETERLKGEVANRDEHIEHLSRKNAFLQDKLGGEEDAKRRTLLRYVNAVKANALAAGESGEGGVIQLPESGITDEEVHAVAALLRGNTTIADLNLRGNLITDEGARALGAVLGGRTALRTLDMRGNKIGKQGIRAIAEALERSDRVRHVYVHAGGKVEALGTGRWAVPRDVNLQTGGSSDGAAPMVTVETICVVDVRENTPVADASALEAHVNGHDENPTMTGPGVNGSKSHGMLPGGGATDGSPTRGARTMGASGKPKKKQSATMLHKSKSEEAIRSGEAAR